MQIFKKYERIARFCPFFYKIPSLLDLFCPFFSSPGTGVQTPPRADPKTALASPSPERNSNLPSQSPSVTALPKGEPRIFPNQAKSSSRLHKKQSGASPSQPLFQLNDSIKKEPHRGSLHHSPLSIVNFQLTPPPPLPANTVGDDAHIVPLKKEPHRSSLHHCPLSIVNSQLISPPPLPDQHRRGR